MAFWESLDRLIRENPLVIDRTRGSTHPRFPDSVYPVDYGYLEGTVSGDGHGIDVWRGSLPVAGVQGILVNIDMLKKDVEVKLIVGCTEDETRIISSYNNTYALSSIYIKRIEG